MRSHRMQVSLPEDVDAKIAVYAKKMMISKAAVVNIAIQAGMKSLEMAVNPDWQAYFEKAIREGKPIILPTVDESKAIKDLEDLNDWAAPKGGQDEKGG